MTNDEARTDTPNETLVIVKAAPLNAETPLHALQHQITPTPSHFIRSNFPVPPHDGQITITGTVEAPLTLTLDELRAMPSTTLAVTLECAGNGRIGLAPLPEGEPWARQAVGTARWTGARLADVLARAAIRPEAVEVTFTGADGGDYKGTPGVEFTRALPLEHATDPARDVLVAWAMNGEPLPPDHGGPLRLLVPGWYGMASVKWLARIDLRDTPYQGQFQTHSYMYHWPDRAAEPVDAIRPRAMILDPAPNARLVAGRHLISGRVWSGGGRAIEAVEVSVTAGEWQPAMLTPAGSPYEWRSWSYEWPASILGRHAIRARAIDADGNVQPDSGEWNRLGYGNNAVQVVLVDIVDET